MSNRPGSARVALVLLVAMLSSSSAFAQQPEWGRIDAILGRKGSALSGGVVKYGFPRTDLAVTARGVRLKPAFALGGWLAFEGIGGGRVQAMGDLVLAESEVEPMIVALERGGVEVTALHNHLLGERPRIMYMHVHATGDPLKIAQAVHAALATAHIPLAAGRAGPSGGPLDLDTAAIVRALGARGTVNGGVYQVGIPRRDTIRVDGTVIPPAMGVATGLNFQPTGRGGAAVTGDFVLTASEVNPVIRALSDNGIAVTAVHTHMLTEEPRLFFVHILAIGNAAALAQGLGRALDEMAVRRNAGSP
jgi:Domain of Unknown Function (DUF1259)